ncbi:MAG: nucleoside deaminase, partial [Phenylobacterium sp.]
MPTEAEFLAQAVDQAMANVLNSGGRPFGAVVVRDGEVIATGVNEIGATGDPTAHAELTAMRRAAQALGVPRLDGCVVYASGQPCPMCLAAMHMTGVAAVRFCYSNDEAEAFGLSTA